MPKPVAIARLERRLAELGCPTQQRERRVREIADHYEDLKVAGLEEGLSEAAAEARANELLGEPVAIAEQLAAALRQSSWWGRHRIIGFCLLPPLGIFVASVLSLFAVLGCLRFCFSASEWRVLADQGSGFRLLVLAVELGSYASTAGISILFCWLAQRSNSGHRWAMLACGVCSLQSYFGYCRISPHAVSIGYSLSPDWICVLIPLCLAAVIWARQSRASTMLNAVSDQGPDFAEAVLGSAEGFFADNHSERWWRKLIAYPTYWVLAVITLALVLLGLLAWAEIARDKLPRQIPKENWHAERVSAAQSPNVSPLNRVANNSRGVSSQANNLTNTLPWQRIVMIGASATAGFTEAELFGGPQTAQYKLSRYIDAALIAPHEAVRSLASRFFFLQPEVEAQRQIDLALESKPSMVIGVDFLFWFCYGEGQTDRDRLARFEKGLKLLDGFSCPLILGDIPDASGAINRMLTPDEIPSTTAMAAANRRLKEWVAVRHNVVILPLSAFMRTVIANEALSVHGRTLPAGKTGILLQTDRLHPSAPGCAVLALTALDTALSKVINDDPKQIRWDPQEVFRRGYNGSQPAAEKP